MNVSVIGSGYVGLVTGACLSHIGHDVVCIDINDKKIINLKKGNMPIYEPGLKEIIDESIKSKKLMFSSSMSGHVENADVIFIAVGTPTDVQGNGFADLSHVYGAAEEISKHISGYTVIVNKSTVPVGTAKQVERIISKSNNVEMFDVISNPEFMREGSAINDFMFPDRIVIGSSSEKATSVMEEIYSAINTSIVLVTGRETAELIKYASNSFLAVKISFINEMSNICEAVGANVLELSEAVGADKRIGRRFLDPGPGYGGSCFPKDTLSLLHTAQEHGVSASVVSAAIGANSSQKSIMVKKIRKALGGCESGKTIAVLGCTFKPDTDDMRDSPVLSILPSLSNRGALIRISDPVGMGEAKKLLPNYLYFDDPYEACIGADVVVLMTEWDQYKNIDFDRVKTNTRSLTIVDMRNLYDKATIEKQGFTYYGVGV